MDKIEVRICPATQTCAICGQEKEVHRHDLIGSSRCAVCGECIVNRIIPWLVEQITKGGKDHE